jgi:hypothetical protein
MTQTQSVELVLYELLDHCRDPGFTATSLSAFGDYIIIALHGIRLVGGRRHSDTALNAFNRARKAIGHFSDELDIVLFGEKEYEGFRDLALLFSKLSDRLTDKHIERCLVYLESVR